MRDGRPKSLSDTKEKCQNEISPARRYNLMGWGCDNKLAEQRRRPERALWGWSSDKKKRSPRNGWVKQQRNLDGKEKGIVT